MKKLLVLLLAIVLSNGYAKPPYETTWIELTKTDNDYIIYNYPNWDDEIKVKSPVKITINKDILTRVIFSDGLYKQKIDGIKNLDNESYIFVIDQHEVYKFGWFDKEKHISRWIKYYYDGDIMRDKLFIDSAYNTYPIVDYKWDD